MGIDRGQDWCDSLQEKRVLRYRESGLIKAAERVCYVTNTLRTTPPISIRSVEAG